MKLDNELYNKQEKELIKYYHKLLLADLLYLNYEHSTFKYDGITEDDIIDIVIKETKYTKLETKEILKDANKIIKIKYKNSNYNYYE